MKTPMMAITTNSSISVNAGRRGEAGPRCRFIRTSVEQAGNAEGARRHFNMFPFAGPPPVKLLRAAA